ncbi:MAG: prolipoprotein diacylglyceryl transferase [Candidatus Latescibacterota bacterium]|jgi:phosphatidylglycerol:prolipoprotein diacylglycerol transferase
MHPTLIDAGWFQIRSYGLMLALSFLIGIYVAAWRAKQYGIKPHHILDLSVYIILAAVVGSRLMYVLFHLEDFDSPLEYFALWEGGATFYGGLLLAIAASVWYTRRKGLKFLVVADVMAPSIALGMGLTRVGCFLSGCCFGRPTEGPFGVIFPMSCQAGRYAANVASDLGVQAVHLHPTQIYSSIYGLVIFAILLYAGRKLTKTGALFGLLLVLAGLARFTVDFFRFYEPSARTIAGVTVSQLTAVVFILLGIFLIARKTGSASTSPGK